MGCARLQRSCVALFMRIIDACLPLSEKYSLFGRPLHKLGWRSSPGRVLVSGLLGHGRGSFRLSRRLNPCKTGTTDSTEKELRLICRACASHVLVQCSAQVCRCLLITLRYCRFRYGRSGTVFSSAWSVQFHAVLAHTTLPSIPVPRNTLLLDRCCHSHGARC